MGRGLLILACSAACLSTGCGGLDDAKRAGAKGAAKVERELSALQRKAARRANGTLAKLKRVVPRADRRTVVPTRRAGATLADYQDDVLRSLSRYWTRTFEAEDLPASGVRHVYVAAGKRARTRCRERFATARSAFYCADDDTIFLGDVASKVQLVSTGPFGVAVVLAHEYGHNVQAELGWRRVSVPTVAPYEQQADCLAGVWAASVYREGLIDDDDVIAAIATAADLGDLEFDDQQHHGTAGERAAAFAAGYDSADPIRCRAFVPD